MFKKLFAIVLNLYAFNSLETTVLKFNMINITAFKELL